MKQNSIKMNKEIWKDIEGYEGIFAVSNHGRIKQYSRIVNSGNGAKRIIKEKIFKAYTKPNGYCFIRTSLKSKCINFMIHRLVAEAFIPNPYNLPQVNHKDEDKTNNVVTNLEWCDAKYNSNYGTKNERIAEKISKPIIRLDLKGNVICEYQSAREAARQTGILPSSICNCLKGISKKCGGSLWQYKE